MFTVTYCVIDQAHLFTITPNPLNNPEQFTVFLAPVQLVAAELAFF